VIIDAGFSKPLLLCLPGLLLAEQFWSTEALGMGIFYTLNVFIMQFYLGKCEAAQCSASAG